MFVVANVQYIALNNAKEMIKLITSIGVQTMLSRIRRKNNLF